MTEHKDDPGPDEEHIEDLEAPASRQENVAGGMDCGETCDIDTFLSGVSLLFC
jgi:hypothetical protein